MTINLTKHHILRDLKHFVEQTQPLDLAMKRLNHNQNFKLSGYWHEKIFYKEISFINPLSVSLKTASVSLVWNDNHIERLIKFYFLLKADGSKCENQIIEEVDKTGHMFLSFNTKLELVSEDWFVDVLSPYVIAKKDESINN
ncbi:hypothetical protein Cylst_4365 [Cylindrospermum stagnale PCC 7417]|uniref:Uncharacterized protein n=1 Tax=Cylindrospermum stagnale PCC 7417 TaxID=56107 RepID=K9X313_9NOST|nr:hypothetical protein [Cylindrospermum stagnale]AFZ26456.1 hypothetical protein Cylst_4365 [Cylindrospermum stagnale PCC 7417]